MVWTAVEQTDQPTDRELFLLSHWTKLCRGGGCQPAKHPLQKDWMRERERERERECIGTEKEIYKLMQKRGREILGAAPH